MQQVYEDIVESSKARRLLVDLYISNGSGSWLRNLMTVDNTPKGFRLRHCCGFSLTKEGKIQRRSRSCANTTNTSLQRHCDRARSKGVLVKESTEIVTDRPGLTLSELFPCLRMKHLRHRKDYATFHQKLSSAVVTLVPYLNHCISSSS